MRRRHLLTAVGTVAVTTASGCSGIGGPTLLTSPREEREDSGETHLHFGEDERLATLTVRPDRHVADPPVPVDIHLWHREETRVTALDLRFRATAGLPPNPPGDVYVAIPQWTDSPDVRLHSTADGEWRVLKLGGLEQLGDGTVSIPTHVRPFGDGASALTIVARVSLEEPGVFGTTYRLDGRTTVSLPVELPT